MTTNEKTAQSTRHNLQRVAVLAVGYVVLIFLLPANKASMGTYHFSPLQYRTVLFAIALPSLLTWFAAFAGYSKLNEYVAIVRKTPEGGYFDRLATGCAWLAWSLPLPTLAFLVLEAAADTWPRLNAATIIIGNYLNLLLPLVAFIIIGNASRGLVNRAKLHFSLSSVRTIMLIFLLAGVVYCYLIFKRFNLADLGSSHNDFFLPVWLIVITVIIPYLYAWFAGLLAAYEITLYSNQVSGVLYRRALQLMVSGLAVIIVGSVALQYTNSVSPSVGHLVLGFRLVLITVFRIIEGGGFVLLAMGAARLKRIEEV